MSDPDWMVEWRRIRERADQESPQDLADFWRLRDEQIFRQHQAGASTRELAAFYQVSHQRIGQILKRQKRRHAEG